MAIKQYRPLTPGRRFATVDPMRDVTKKRPEKRLILSTIRGSGRDSSGRISVRHRGGGERRYLRIIDWRQDRFDQAATVVAIEYDPNRNARIALVEYADGERRYILAPDGLTAGMTIVSSQTSGEASVGSRYPLSRIPIGSFVCNVELKPRQGGKIARSAGSSVQLMAIEEKSAHLKMPSGEIRRVPSTCFATVGTISNPDHRHHVLGKAGRMRHLGIRPRVRGKAMNPVDHPHGGGEGKNPIGLKFAKTLWGKHAMGVKTRRAKKYSDSLILERRKK